MAPSEACDWADAGGTATASSSSVTSESRVARVAGTGMGTSEMAWVQTSIGFEPRSGQGAHGETVWAGLWHDACLNSPHPGAGACPSIKRTPMALSLKTEH